MNPFEFFYRWAGRRPRPAIEQRTTDSRNRSRPTAKASTAPAKASEVDELKHRIEELELLLTKRPPRKNTRKPKNRRKA